MLSWLWLWMLCVAGWAAPPVVGFRHGGDGAVDEGLPPLDQVRWRTPMPSWSNATPVVVGNRVCVTAEPLTVLCVDTATGRVLWRDDVTVQQGMTPDQRAEWDPRIAEAAAAEAEHAVLRAEVSRLRRLQRGGDAAPDVADRLRVAAARLEALQATVERVGPVTGAEDWWILGFATPSPVSDGRRLYVQFGNGLVGAWTLTGERVWLRWLGEAHVGARGYEHGRTSGPVIAGDVLAVPHGVLRGLDAATGADRWRDDLRWRDFGTPTLVDVDGLLVIATPLGRLVRARDGRRLADGVADRYHQAPVVVGTTLYGMGGAPIYETSSRGVQKEASLDSRVARWDLARSGDDVVVTEVWNQPFPTGSALYAHPAFTGQGVVAALAQGALWVVDLNGVTRRWVEPPVSLGYPSPVWTTDGLLVAGDDGRAALVRPDGSVVGPVTWGLMRASPVVAGGHVYVRTLDALLSIGPS